MAALLIVKGTNEGLRIPLEKDRLILGRSPDCDVVIPAPSVSRQHARLLRLQDRWYLEDMQSRNGTTINHQPVQARMPVREGDRIRIADTVFVFHDTTPAPAATLEACPAEPEPGEADNLSSLGSTISYDRDLFQQIHSAETLRAILETSNRLSKALEMDVLLPKIGAGLFELFPQAERCFVVMTDALTGQLQPRLVKTRQPEEERTARFSRTLARLCLENIEAILSENVSDDRRIPPSHSVIAAQIRSVMCAPLGTVEQRPFGVLQLDTREGGRRFTRDDLKLLVGVANQVSIALENATHYESLLAREQFERDLELAAHVQRSLLPDEVPAVEGYEFFAHYASALEVGGDYYDFIPLPPQRLAVTLGDVAGKGMPAALLMAKLSSDARFGLLAEADPARAVARLNDLLFRQTRETDRFVTFLAAVLDPARHDVTLVSAGHMSPLLYRHADGTVCEVLPYDQVGVPLGIRRGEPYTAAPLALAPGDCLVLYTDGVSAALDLTPQSSPLDGIREVFRGDPVSPARLGERLLKATERAAAGRSQVDDITIVCFGRTA
jgi:serine phosphatase RsbU (regulator of sigma subunit)